MTIIRTAAPPSMIGAPNVPLQDVNAFEQLIFNKGYTVIIENAIECPCKGKTGSAKTTCQSCLGMGWVFMNPVETKAIITSANAGTKYKYWSPELQGTVNVTTRDSERLAFMDKITMKSRTSILSEVKPIITDGSNKFVFCSYNIKAIRSVYIFNTDTVKLIKLNATQYSVGSGNTAVLQLSNSITYPANFNGVVTIEYEFEVSYCVQDIPHEFRSSFITDQDGKNVEYGLPVQAIARRTHLVMGKGTNYAGNNMLDNSD